MTAVEFQTQQIGILVSKLFNDEISKAEFHFKRFEIGDQSKEMEKQQELMHNKMLEMLKIISNGFDDSKKHLIIKKAKELIKEITEI